MFARDIPRQGMAVGPSDNRRDYQPDNDIPPHSLSISVSRLEARGHVRTNERKRKR